VDALCEVASGASGGKKGKGKEKETIPSTPKKSSKFLETGVGAEGAVARTKIEDVMSVFTLFIRTEGRGR
jgi:hypothetical protein